MPPARDLSHAHLQAGQDAIDLNHVGAGNSRDSECALHWIGADARRWRGEVGVWLDVCDPTGHVPEGDAHDARQQQKGVPHRIG
jgi:hypothetical protein